MNKRVIMVTGGAGFIGSNLLIHLVNKYPDYQFINIDKLTYAGNLANLDEIALCPNYKFIQADITDFDKMKEVISKDGVNGIIHLAAESHVDRSIRDPFIFAKTNVLGTLSLLQAAKEVWENSTTGYDGKLFYHISTDEVYGSLDINTPEIFFTEQTSYAPHSPYSASKASSDHFVAAFHDTYDFPSIITNCSNNYGPFQFPEKLIPLFINNIRHGKELPVYGEGLNVRDWLYVGDHVKAIDLIFHNASPGDKYNIGGNNEWRNIDLVKALIAETDRQLGRQEGASAHLIRHITDRAGHDLRYAIDSSKLQKKLGWKPSVTFEEGLKLTVKWYLDHQEWTDNVTSGDYLKYYREYYRTE